MRGLALVWCLVAGCECGRQLAPFDGGSEDAGGSGGGGGGGTVTLEDAGRPAECAEVLARGGHGAGCPPCMVYDFACAAYVRCQTDGGFDVVGGCRPGGPIGCLPFASGTRLTGTTPLGDVDFRAAWGSPAWAFQHDLIVQFGNTPTAEYSPAASLGFMTLIDVHSTPAVTIARLVLDGGVAFVPAEITLDAIDAGRAQGTVFIAAQGWSVSGFFDIPLCPELDRSGP